MIDMLGDLLRHSAWADDVHWSAFESHPGALDDEELRNRIYHIHLVQYSFLTIVKRGQFHPKRLDEFQGMEGLRQYGIDNHREALRLLDRFSPADVEARVDIPWFRDPPLTLTVGQALLQSSMHSQYHRGQNATRFRQLGGMPPLIDYIAWCWKGSPAPGWMRSGT